MLVCCAPCACVYTCLCNPLRTRQYLPGCDPALYVLGRLARIDLGLCLVHECRNVHLSRGEVPLAYVLPYVLACTVGTSGLAVSRASLCPLRNLMFLKCQRSGRRAHSCIIVPCYSFNVRLTLLITCQTPVFVVFRAGIADVSGKKQTPHINRVRWSDWTAARPVGVA